MFDRMKLGTRALVAIGVVVGITLGLGLFNIVQLHSADEADRLMYEQTAGPLSALADFRVAFYRAQVSLLGAAEAVDAGPRTERVTAARDRLRDTDAALDHLDKLLKGETVREPLQNTQRAYLAWRDDMATAVDQVGKNNRDGVFEDALQGALSRKMATARDANVKLIEAVVKHAGDRASANSAMAGSAVLWSKALIALAVLSGLGLALLLFKSVSREIRRMVNEAERLCNSAVAGELASRADLGCVSPEFSGVMGGFNDVLDAVVTPLNVAAGYVDRISKGDIPPPITDKYNGDFNTIKNNLNTCIGAMNALVAEADALAEAAVQGKLATRADASKHQGGFRRIIAGTNAVMDRVVGIFDSLPLPVMLIDRDRTIVYMNRIGAELGGQTQQGLIGHKCFDHFKTDDCHNGACACLKAMTVGAATQAQTTARPGGSSSTSTTAPFP